MFSHVGAKVLFSCKSEKFSWFYGFQWFFKKITKIKEITLKIRKSMFSTNPRPFTKPLFFLGQMDGSEPWDHQNLEISRIPLNLMEFQYFIEIMLNFGNFSRFLVKITFWATWRVPGGPAPCWKGWYSYRNIDVFEVPRPTQNAKNAEMP